MIVGPHQGLGEPRHPGGSAEPSHWKVPKDDTLLLFPLPGGRRAWVRTSLPASGQEAVPSTHPMLDL